MTIDDNYKLKIHDNQKSLNIYKLDNIHFEISLKCFFLNFWKNGIRTYDWDKQEIVSILYNLQIGQLLKYLLRNNKRFFFCRD